MNITRHLNSEFFVRIKSQCHKQGVWTLYPNVLMFEIGEYLFIDYDTYKLKFTFCLLAIHLYLNIQMTG